MHKLPSPLKNCFIALRAQMPWPVLIPRHYMSLIPPAIAIPHVNLQRKGLALPLVSAPIISSSQPVVNSTHPCQIGIVLISLLPIALSSGLLDCTMMIVPSLLEESLPHQDPVWFGYARLLAFFIRRLPRRLPVSS